MSDTPPFDSFLKWKLGIESPSLAYAAKTVTRNIILAVDVPYPLLKLWHDFIKTQKNDRNHTYGNGEPSSSTPSNLHMHESNMRLSYWVPFPCATLQEAPALLPYMLWPNPNKRNLIWNVSGALTQMVKKIYDCLFCQNLEASEAGHRVLWRLAKIWRSAKVWQVFQIGSGTYFTLLVDRFFHLNKQKKSSSTTRDLNLINDMDASWCLQLSLIYGQ